jgi:hypothetical protein
VYHCALKIQKFFKYFFTGKTLPFYTAFGEASGKGGAFYVKQVLGFARGSWRWGCAEEWLGLKGPVRLAYARCKAKKP